MSGERGTAGAGESAMSVAVAKARLREWGEEAEQAQRMMLEAARAKAKKATPYAALAAGVLGVLSAGGLFGRRKRRGRDREGGEEQRGGGIDGLLPLILAGVRMAPTVMGMMERVMGRGRRESGE